MASGFRTQAGIDLDSIFVARTSSARANTGYTVAGVDFAQRYEKYAGGAQAALTGMRDINNSDMNALFAIPSSAGPVPPAFAALSPTGVAQAGIVSVSCNCTIAADGNWSEQSNATLSGQQNFAGLWYSPPATGIGAGYTVQFTWTPTATAAGMTTTPDANTGQLALSSARAWNITMTGNPVGNKTSSGTLNVIIRTSGGTVVSNTNVTYTLNAH